MSKMTALIISAPFAGLRYRNPTPLCNLYITYISYRAKLLKRDRFILAGFIWGNGLRRLLLD